MATHESPEDPRGPRRARPADGVPPSDRDQFFLAAGWRLIENGPQLIQQAAKQVMAVTAILSGVYFGAIQLGQLVALLPAAWRLLLLVPYALWLPAFCCAWRSFRPEQLRLPEAAPDATAEALRKIAAAGAGWLKAAQWLLFLGLVLMVVMIVCTFLVAGEVGR